MPDMRTIEGPELLPFEPRTPEWHDPAVCRHPILSALCPACAQIWAKEIRDNA